MFLVTNTDMGQNTPSLGEAQRQKRNMFWCFEGNVSLHFREPVPLCPVKPGQIM